MVGLEALSTPRKPRLAVLLLRVLLASGQPEVVVEILLSAVCLCLRHWQHEELLVSIQRLCLGH